MFPLHGEAAKLNRYNLQWLQCGMSVMSGERRTEDCIMTLCDELRQFMVACEVMLDASVHTDELIISNTSCFITQ